MADRRRQIALLIGSRFDYDWSPAGSLRTAPGLAPGVKRECPACGGDRYTLDRFKRKQPCETCGGRPANGATRGKLGRGWVYVDRMDADRTPIASADHRDVATKPAHTVTCDACGGQGVGGAHLRDLEDPGSEYRDPCERCNGSGRRVVATFDLAVNVCGACDGSGRRDHKTCDRCGGSGQQENVDVDQITAAIGRRDQAGSYHELDLALAGISRHVNKPLRYEALTLNAAQAKRLLDEVYLTRLRTLDKLTMFEQALVELAMDYIDQRMPDPIRVPAGVAANQRTRDEHLRKVHGRGTSTQALAQRDKEIRKLIRQRKPTQWVAAEFGLTVSQVNRIVAGDTEAVSS